MNGVRLMPLAPPAKTSALRKGRFSSVAYRAALRMPGLYKWIRGREDTAQINRDERILTGIAAQLAPDIIHAFRTVPEGALGLRLKQRFPQVPFFLSTWGQDLVAWTKFGRRVHAETRRVIEAVDVLFPDNPRDARLASEEFGLSKSARVHVMPAPGGVDTPALMRVDAAPLAAGWTGSPRLLAARGYENVYVKLRVQLEAFRLFRLRYPEAHLYIDGPAGHPGKEQTLRWIQRLQLQNHVSLVHLDRGAFLASMKACDLYVSATLSDGLPVSLLEALYFGLIPAVYDHESTAPLLRSVAEAATFTRMSPEDIAACWSRALSAAPTREHRMARNREVIRGQYDRDSNLSRVAEMYRRAVTEAR